MRTTKRATAIFFAISTSALLGRSSVMAQVTFPPGMRPHEIVVTCFSGIGQGTPGSPVPTLVQDPTKPVAVVIDTRNPTAYGAIPDSNWALMPGFEFWNKNAGFNTWNGMNLGEVFGVTIDQHSPPNIYVTATEIYGYDTSPGPVFTQGPAKAGGIYRIDGLTGAVTYNRLPNSGPGLGNICHYRAGTTDWLYVSNFDDGVIYRVDAAALTFSGGVVPPPLVPGLNDTFDHGSFHNATQNQNPPELTDGFRTRLDRLIWGVKVFGDRLYYAVCRRDTAHRGPNKNEIWSVALNPATGDFIVNSETKEVDLTDFPEPPSSPPTGLAPYSAHVASIEFTDDGRMLLAERYTRWDAASYVSTPNPYLLPPHHTRLLEYIGGPGAWTPSTQTKFRVGGTDYQPPNFTNSAGGVAADCDGTLWATGDALHVVGPGYPYQDYVYGLQEIAPNGNQSDPTPTTNSILIDLDGNTASTIDKTQIGAVDLYRFCPTQSDACCGAKPHFDDTLYSGTFTGQIAVATGFASNLADAVLRIFDLKNQASAPLNTNYAPPSYSGPNGLWSKQNLGSIFGLTLDDTGSIYVTATSAYNSTDFFPGGLSGAIYKIDGSSGAIVPGGGVPWVTLPNDPMLRPALGNISYDCEHANFFVTNMFDGLIYRLDTTGATLSTWDHGAHLVPPIPRTDIGFAPLGRRLWGLQRNPADNRLYYAVWWEDQGRPSATQSNEIWSVALSATGDFVPGTQRLEVSMSTLPNLTHSNPVSDISFSPSGAMLLTERTMTSDTTSGAFGSRAVECTFNSGLAVWSCNTAKYVIGEAAALGGLPGQSAGGGAYDFSAGGRVWVSGDALKGFGSASQIDGLQGIPASGGTIVNSILIDLNNDLSVPAATEIGDVGIPCPDCEINGSVVTPTTANGPYTYQFTITNHSNQSASSLVFLPISGVTSITPPAMPISPALQPGQTSQVYTVTLGGVQPGTQACFNVALVASNGSNCCSLQVCVPIPSCFEVVSQSVSCPTGGAAQLTITIKNLESYTLYHAAILPSDPNKTATPPFINLPQPVPPFCTTTITTTFAPVANGETVFYTLTIHAAQLEICCSRVLSFTANCPMPTAPVALAAVSRMTHGAAGEFDIPLPLSGPSGIENRRSSEPGALNLVFTFDEDITAGAATITSGTGAVSGTPTANGNQVEVHLTDVADAQRITLSLDVTDISGQIHSPQSVSMGILLGDVNGNGVVNATDVGQVRAQSGQPVAASNFRNDVNCTGAINATDIGTTKSRSGNSLP